MKFAAYAEGGTMTRSARAEQRRADAHRSGAKSDRGLEVGAHAHGELGEAVSRRDLGGEREVGAGRLFEGRDAHQALDGEPERAAAARDERVSFERDDAGLLRLLAGVDLDVEARA